VSNFRNYNFRSIQLEVDGTYLVEPGTFQMYVCIRGGP
jgi:hypothetical protein